MPTVTPPKTPQNPKNQNPKQKGKNQKNQKNREENLLKSRKKNQSRRGIKRVFLEVPSAARLKLFKFMKDFVKQREGFMDLFCGCF